MTLIDQLTLLTYGLFVVGTCLQGRRIIKLKHSGDISFAYLGLQAIGFVIILWKFILGGDLVLIWGHAANMASLAFLITVAIVYFPRKNRSH